MAGICPACEEFVVPTPCGAPSDHAGVATVWCCPSCSTILGVSEWMG